MDRFVLSFAEASHLRWFGDRTGDGDRRLPDVALWVDNIDIAARNW
ncbi:hypothetical protein [Oxynema aestuarii]|uniref:Uncharacterized protein n=1 Tax=Oxynema aestuarii AP17 TaxID=2064643 RepID=A0A6H1TX81_9CYAN|nr:hypothetical protein [Oxynema aestuarii]QIZ69959.1 hypothetical protein HCG48_04675 [Oxynema aestuarii AP17]